MGGSPRAGTLAGPVFRCSDAACPDQEPSGCRRGRPRGRRERRGAVPARRPRPGPDLTRRALRPRQAGLRRPEPQSPASGSYLRELPGARAQSGRAKRRTSRTYFAAINDFQLADEESPARIDSLAPVQPNTSAWRPQEALMPQTIDATIRRLNQFTAASPNSGRQRHPRAHGPGADRRRQLRQPAGEREHLGAPAAGGRSDARPQQRRRRLLHLHQRAARRPAPARPRTRQPATPVSRTTPTTTTAPATATSTTRPGRAGSTPPGPRTAA